jgi:hypothetical protein
LPLVSNPDALNPFQLDSIDLQHNISQVHGSNYYSRINFGTLLLPLLLLWLLLLLLPLLPCMPALCLLPVVSSAFPPSPGSRF